MAIIAPFRAWRYNPNVVPDLTEVVAPPYDIIGPEQQSHLHRRHPWNVVRLELGEDLPEDDERSNRYTRAAAYLSQWRTAGVLSQDETPSVYLYRQTFRGEGGSPLVRTGFVALLRLEPLGGGVVFPHEETFPKHKADRLALLRACRAQFNPIFSLYPDADGEVRKLLGTPDAAPDHRVSDGDGVTHEMWVLPDEDSIRTLVHAMGSKPIFIADGHHRYETSLRFRDESAASAHSRTSCDWTLMYFAAMEDEGLVIHATHRMVQELPGFDSRGFLSSLEEQFRLTVFPFEPSEEISRQSFLQKLKQEGAHLCAIGMAIHGEARYWVLTPRNPEALCARWTSLPECVRKLDVTVLHEAILRESLGIDVAHRQAPQLVFSHDAHDALHAVLQGRVRMGFIVNPTRVEDLRAVASARCKMPQKATYFYPKLLSGMVVYDVGSQESHQATNLTAK
jgi:uncharacterized protein (DUF1015 family)